jgi:hypothetical protein
MSLSVTWLHVCSICTAKGLFSGSLDWNSVRAPGSVHGESLSYEKVLEETMKDKR